MASNVGSPEVARVRRRKRNPRSEENDVDEECENMTKSHRTSKVPRTDASLYHAGRQYPPMDQRYGVIERISVKNFMCHAQLEFVFAPRVNFIIGRNGSTY
ncbi:structural maintenance of chromosomes protein 6-like [Tropilaelaps mercedesae]|uniref:Structural maintenance of chromosomes protein 6-like n=1 Tax=Tropilaelaps mercedesae TaxID=418985 RepID=A0A1V9XYT7_9ACAR|nr:structural maintenance of chromosomes protein 6-like [Tropilaelaps mercedesae]